MRIQIKNVSAGASFKLPGGVRVRKGGTVSVPQGVLSKSYVRSNIVRGRLVIVQDTLEDETTAPAPVAPPEPPPRPLRRSDVATRRRRRRLRPRASGAGPSTCSQQKQESREKN